LFIILAGPYLLNPDIDHPHSLTTFFTPPSIQPQRILCTKLEYPSPLYIP
jgi:hypothetical protein